MKKIKTIFERDWDGDRKVIDKFVVAQKLLLLSVATEKLDGTNVRATIRTGMLVRLEKRRNPDKIQKHKGIEEPWYVDASEGDPQDRYLWDAVRNTNLTELPDGEWSGEVVGPNVQGNPLKLEQHKIIFFSLGQAPIFENVPTSYDELKEWLPKQKSKIGNDCGIEGIVWHCEAGEHAGEMYKIKVRDFKEDR